ncbi:MAG: hypothetical protein EBR59_06075 [Methylococcaceae bacterium]|mgnify:CR=1 FL=1|jgi:ABC-type transporter Mla subunit MlaD|nr:hypothetical protein [Methylococcaceae bacterium]
MKILKSAVVAFSLAIAMGSFSTAAVAEAGRTSYKPIDAVKGVQERLAKAEAAIASNAAGDDVAALIKAASDFSEEINANDRVARENSKSLKALRAAVSAAKAGNLAEASEGIKKSKESLANIVNLI